ncbi:unnamed protein product [Calicophoron daubneyi]|uniref:Ig-like domain-containing protein n=1 Tax=Calicophoron daubneyi TaxID=300641 RepID=A0AAV2T2K8_CALDB
MLFLLISCLLPLICTSLKVESIANGTLGTYEKELEMEGFRYWKNSRNETAHATLEFIVDELISADMVKWTLNGQSLVPGDREDSVYMELHNAGYEVSLAGKTRIDLYLKNKGVVPGEYNATVTSSESSEAIGVVMSAPILPEFSKIKRVLEKDSVTLSCEYTGYPEPTEVSWKFVAISKDNTNGNLESTPSAPRVSPKSVKTVNDTLKFEQVQMADNGLYICETKNAIGNDTTVIFVNVKGQWDALWPFIGIVIEVAVLVTAILLYERHQMRSKPAKPETIENSLGQTKSQQQQQQNNLVTQVNAADGNIAADTATNNTVDRDTKANADEVRARMTTKC